ncbi:MAG: hypothetical protein ACU836_12150 [Gammaproteobacteria bacterium]
MFRIFTSRTKHSSLVKGLLLISLSLYLPSISMAKPAEVRLSALENCQFLGKVEGSSGYGRKSDWLRPAKSSALSRAENLGGSHIVWERMNRVGVYNGHAVARVFSCS